MNLFSCRFNAGIVGSYIGRVCKMACGLFLATTTCPWAKPTWYVLPACLTVIMILDFVEKQMEARVGKLLDVFHSATSIEDLHITPQDIVDEYH